MCRYTAERLKSTGKQSIFNLGDDTDLTHGGSNIRDIDKFDNPQRNEHTFQLQSFLLGFYVTSSVVDLWLFRTVPDPRICKTDLRIRILLFLLMAFKMPTESKFFSTFFAYNFIRGTCT